MLTYFTFRPLRIGSELLHPQGLLTSGFTGLEITYDVIWWDQNIDGRILASFEFPDDPDPSRTSDIRASILEALQAFGAHEKSIISAMAFLAYVSPLKYEVLDGRITAPLREDIR